MLLTEIRIEAIIQLNKNKREKTEKEMKQIKLIKVGRTGGTQLHTCRAEFNLTVSITRQFILLFLPSAFGTELTNRTKNRST